MRCAGAPAAVNIMQLALQKGDDGSYPKLSYDKIITNFKIEELVSRWIPVSSLSFCLVDLGQWRRRSLCMALSYGLRGRPHLRFRGAD